MKKYTVLLCLFVLFLSCRSASGPHLGDGDPGFGRKPTPVVRPRR